MGRIYTLMADREFIGEKWFKWLNINKIPIDIRIKSDSIVEHRGQCVKASEFFKDMRGKSRKVIKGIVKVYGYPVRLSGGPSKSGTQQDKWCIIASSSLPHTAHNRYGRRWTIEQMFKDFKSSGFDLEKTHVTFPDRLSQLLALLAIAFVWIVKVGSAEAEKKPALIKKLKHNRPRKSIFRLGLDLLREAFWNYHSRKMDYLINFLSPT